MRNYAPDASALVCLDLQRERLTTENAAATVAACRIVLEQARRRRWPVLHVYARHGAAAPDRPIAGLEPLPSEAVSVVIWFNHNQKNPAPVGESAGSEAAREQRVSSLHEVAHEAHQTWGVTL